MQTMYIFIDDSGVLHPNDPYFVYAGYVFLSKSDREHARRKYRTLVSKLKSKLDIQGELKACYLERKHKRALFNVMRDQESFFVAIDNSRVHQNIMKETRSRHRYKDYVLKRIIKDKVSYFIRNQKIDPNKDLKICICIDEQHTATNGYYDLKSSIYEELVSGVSNFDYGKTFEPILYGELDIQIQFCDSAFNYLVQASDILANRVYTSLVINKPDLRIKNKNTNLYLP